MGVSNANKTLFDHIKMFKCYMEKKQILYKVNPQNHFGLKNLVN